MSIVAKCIPRKNKLGKWSNSLFRKRRYFLFSIVLKLAFRKYFLVKPCPRIVLRSMNNRSEHYNNEHKPDSTQFFFQLHHTIHAFFLINKIHIPCTLNSFFPAFLPCPP